MPTEGHAMSLNRAERETTSEELRANLLLSDLSDTEVLEALGFSPSQLEATLSVDPASDPADVWLLRDFILQTLGQQERDPRPFTVLTDDARVQAQRWFTLREVPPTPQPRPEA